MERSPVLKNPQLPLSSRLWPIDWKGIEHVLPGELFAIIVFVTVAGPEIPTAELPLRVQFVRVSVPKTW
jgi:hypothetical protein